jgi:hypothetical protein
MKNDVDETMSTFLDYKDIMSRNLEEHDMLIVYTQSSANACNLSELIGHIKTHAPKGQLNE